MKVTFRNEIKRHVMAYAWKLARFQAKEDNCTAKECFAWALKKAWERLDMCNACFDSVQLVQAYDVDDVYNDDVLVPLPAIMAMFGLMETRFVLVWNEYNAIYGVRSFNTTGQRFTSIEEARNAWFCIKAQLGLSTDEMPYIAYVSTGLKGWGC